MPSSSILPLPEADARAHSERVAAHIHEEIVAAGGWMSFARYMERTLYAPGLGYYAAGAAKLGEMLDFHNFTLEREKPKKPHFEFHITKTGFTGSKTMTVTLKPGNWRFYCSNHEAQMHGDFKVTK